MKRKFDEKKVLKILKNIFELEMAGVVRYTHYSLMIFGSNRLPLVDFLLFALITIINRLVPNKHISVKIQYSLSFLSICFNHFFDFL